MGCGCGCGESSALTVFPKSQQRQAKPHLCSGLNHLGARGRHSRDKSCYHCSPTPPPPPRAVSHFREKHAGPGGCHNGSEAGTLRLGPGKSSGFQELPFPETITTSTLMFVCNQSCLSLPDRELRTEFGLLNKHSRVVILHMIPVISRGRCGLFHTGAGAEDASCSPFTPCALTASYLESGSWYLALVSTLLLE